MNGNPFTSTITPPIVWARGGSPPRPSFKNSPSILPASCGGSLLLLIFALMEQVPKNAKQKILGFLMKFRNFYWWTTTLFLVWLSFFDRNDLISQFKLWLELRQTQADIRFYNERIEDVLIKNKEINGGDPKQLEKFAREQYLMKKPNEDLYLIQEEK